ncbi:hypothetical protein BGZ94_001266 [Podila epigama]|nr:hypothetical protein BGZ94_001266 [Podila epigama]
MTSAHHLVLITGANRGFGASVARSYLNHSGASTISFILVGRNEQGLTTVLRDLEQNAGTVAVKGIVIGNVDLADTEALEHNLERIRAAAAQLREAALQAKYQLTFEVLPPLQTVHSSTFLKDTQAAFPKDTNPDHKTVIVSISSLLAVQAFPYWGLYAAGKAARDRFLGVMALEEKSNNVKTLNYAPGPLDNEMQADVRNTLGDPEQLQIYGDMHKNGSLVQMDDSSRKLVLLLKKDEYTTGAHIDYYDE